jgi:uncharacterized protein YigE (DUF2233 family)
MTGKPSFLHVVPILLGGLLATGCGRAGVVPQPSATAASVIPLPSPLTPLLAQTPLPEPTSAASPTPIIPDTGWERLRPGLERRVINLLRETGEPFEHLFILRLEPNRYLFGVGYHPQPQSLEAWQSETNALIVLNGGYFRLEAGIPVPNGLAITNGEAMGSSYGDFAGMFAITQHGPKLRWLAQEPYDPNEPLLAALQSFPVLVKPGGQLGFPAGEEDNQAARRSVVGMDRDGRLVLLVASIGNFTLHKLSAYLVQSDLDLDIAINLDGGPSSGMLLAEPFEVIPAYAPLPIVITVIER